MKTRKRVDDLYRDKFKNVETPPPAEVWDNILDRLPEERPERRILPIWYALGGAAAAVVLMFLIFNFNEPASFNPGITDIPSQGSYKYYEPSTHSQNTSLFDRYMLRSSIILEAARIATEGKVLQSGQQKYSYPVQNLKQEHYTGIVQESEAPIQKDINSEYLFQNNKISEGEKNNAGQEGAYTFLEYLKEGNEITPNADQENIKTLPKISETGNEIAEEVITEEPEDPSSLTNRFSVTPTAGAVYFDNLGSGNSLDEQFANNSGSGEISMAYGVNLAYQVSNNLKIRSGISKVNLSYNTRDVNFSTAVNSRAISSSSQNEVLLSSAGGSLNQSMGFVEIPLEMEYALINRKLGLNLIGGASTLLLDKNMVSLRSAGNITDLGEANNLNKTSFSANLGLGAYYKITPRFQMNVEPIFKYQLNTFNNNSGLNAYYFGIYSGLSYKF